MEHSDNILKENLKQQVSFWSNRLFDQFQVFFALLHPPICNYFQVDFFSFKYELLKIKEITFSHRLCLLPINKFKNLKKLLLVLNFQLLVKTSIKTISVIAVQLDRLAKDDLLNYLFFFYQSGTKAAKLFCSSCSQSHFYSFKL